MATDNAVGSAHLIECRLLVDPPAPGAWNMGVDESLLDDAADNGIATLRFYQWSEPTLSLGYFQRYEDRLQHATSHECAAVRRQTGGGAILHDRELTYCLTLPATNPLAKNSQQLYTAVHDAFIHVLARLLTGNNSPWELRRREHGCATPASGEPFLCFERRACGDVILEGHQNEHSRRDRHSAADVTDFKILGSAQRRRRGAILQHGSLLLDKSDHAPELAGWQNLTGIAPNIDDVIVGVARQIHTQLRMQPAQFDFSPELESKAAGLANNKYGSAAWTKRR